eukprot:2902181-Pleurochrysis_carterae.AAC.2
MVINESTAPKTQRVAATLEADPTKTARFPKASPSNADAAATLTSMCQVPGTRDATRDDFSMREIAACRIGCASHSESCHEDKFQKAVEAAKELRDVYAWFNAQKVTFDAIQGALDEYFQKEFGEIKMTGSNGDCEYLVTVKKFIESQLHEFDCQYNSCRDAMLAVKDVVSSDKAYP